MFSQNIFLLISFSISFTSVALFFFLFFLNLIQSYCRCFKELDIGFITWFLGQHLIFWDVDHIVHHLLFDAVNR